MFLKQNNSCKANQMKPKSRFIFIDIARSIAILLMLEGHFVDDLLMDSYRDPNNSIYSTWLFIRGFTSPVFLTVTGIVFVYLLLSSSNEKFWENIRVRKGFKRAIELLFWGYFLQYYAFHVLQCIGVGIFTILSLYGLYRIIKVVPLWIYFFLMGTFIFSTIIYFGTLEKTDYWPVNAPKFIQNMFHGEYSEFPILPRMGYTMYGAMFGVLMHDFKEHVKKWSFATIVILIGLFLYTSLKDILVYFDNMLKNETYHIYKVDWLYEPLGMVMIVLGILMLFEKIVGEIKPNLFLKMGQNTLTVFILHMIFLYGCITGFGLHQFFAKSLTPWQVFFGALLFWILFFTIIHYLATIKEKLQFILAPISKFFNKFYNIQ